MTLPANIRRKLPVAGYVVLALGTAGTFAREAAHNSEQRDALARQTTLTLQRSCKSGNVLRTTLQKIILAGIPQTEGYVKDGTITRAQADRIIASSRESAKAVGPVDCAARKVG